MAFVGIDLGGTQLRVAVADDRGRLKTDGTATGRVRALAIGLPGPVDPAAGLVISPGNLPGFRNVPLNRILTRATGIPSFLHHDAHLAALGEHRRGAARGASEMIYVTVSTGIGAGILLGGELYAGAHGIAGEVGHIVLKPDGPLCTCGQRGDLESIASGTGISRAARELAADTPGSALHGLEHPLAEDVVRAARSSDRPARARRRCGIDRCRRVRTPSRPACPSRLTRRRFPIGCARLAWCGSRLSGTDCALWWSAATSATACSAQSGRRRSAKSTSWSRVRVRSSWRPRSAPR